MLQPPTRAGMFTILALTSAASAQSAARSVSGIYPHLAVYNDEGECGIGAVVPWAERLWVITYAPHRPNGSSDRLYEITPELRLIVRPESIGGTPANRMIHDESGQLFVGPYAIDRERNVRTIPYERMPGRLTGNARDLHEPAQKVLFATMEEGLYEVDVDTLEVRQLWSDEQAHGTNAAADPNRRPANLPGYHGKGLCSGQGVVVYANNGEFRELARQRPDIPSGSLCEWDGEADAWTVIRRNQFTEVTGPGGIHGNENPATDPIWSIGWDHRSLLLGVRSAEARQGSHWRFFRLPKSSHSYDGAHGWNTEWPRIRDIGEHDLLMTMHGAFWRFPRGFGVDGWRGVVPRSNYLKVVGDFCRWQDRLVFGCDDVARNEFLNKRRAKGDIAPGQSHSNLWFVEPARLDRLGPVIGRGAVFVDEAVRGGVPSDAFLLQGYELRGLHLRGAAGAEVALEVGDGDGEWRRIARHRLPDDGYRFESLTDAGDTAWIRVVPLVDQLRFTAAFSFRQRDGRDATASEGFAGLAHSGQRLTGGLLRSRGGDLRTLGLLAHSHDGDEIGYYELDADLRLQRSDDAAARDYQREHAAIPGEVLTVDAASVLVVDDAGRRWRLPKRGDTPDTQAPDSHSLGAYRVDREVVTERDLFHAHGSFYELPAENAGGFAKLRPVATSDRQVHDYCGYRGLLVMTGVAESAAADDPHIVRSQDGRAAVWVGAIDDLWQLGKPRGVGGPWRDSEVAADEPSDPYLMTAYDRKVLTVAADRDVAITVEVDVTGDGTWCTWQRLSVRAGEPLQRAFPDDFSAYWVRCTADADCRATAQLVYE